nr:hypothetical protein [Secundilactobacillus paracollinoides]
MILTGFIILMLVMLVIGLIIGGASRRHQYRAEIANAKQQAEALRDKARRMQNNRHQPTLPRRKRPSRPNATIARQKLLINRRM